MQIANAIGFFIGALFPLSILVLQSSYWVKDFYSLKADYPKKPRRGEYKPTNFELVFMTIDFYDVGFILILLTLAFIPLTLAVLCLLDVLSPQDVREIKEIIHILAN